jgi:hypothetical protein
MSDDKHEDGHGHGPPPGERKHYFDHPQNVRKVLRIFFTCCVLLFSIDLFELAGFHFKHTHYDVEGWVGFYGVYGFIGCTVLVLAAKVLRKIVMRGEDYYDG